MLIFKDEIGKMRYESLGHADSRKAERQRTQKERELRMGFVEPISYLGGGLHLENGSSQVVTECTIVDNLSNGRGGGLFMQNSSLMLVETTIDGNSAHQSRGGGIYFGGSSPTITGCTISNNDADNGGGIYCEYSNTIIMNGCTISKNSVNPGDGGGIYCKGGNMSLGDCVIDGNEAIHVSGDGGGIYATWSSLALNGCSISNNTAKNRGGGFLPEYDEGSALTDCMITGNRSYDDGGGIYSNFGGRNPSLLFVRLRYGGNILLVNLIRWMSASMRLSLTRGWVTATSTTWV